MSESKSTSVLMCRHCHQSIEREHDPWAVAAHAAPYGRTELYFHPDLLDVDCNGIECRDAETVAEPEPTCTCCGEPSDDLDGGICYGCWEAGDEAARRAHAAQEVAHA